MTLAKQNADGAWIEASPPYASTDERGNRLRHPRDIAEKWSDGELALAGLHRIIDDPRPKGVLITGYELVERRGQVYRQWITEPLPVEKRRIPKEIIVRRLQSMQLMDDVHEEFEKLPSVEKHLWFSLVYVDPQDASIVGLLEGAGLTSEQISQVLAPP